MKRSHTYVEPSSVLREGVRLHVARSHRFQVRPHDLRLLELDDLLFATDSAVMMPYPIVDETGRIQTSDEGLLRPQGIGLLYVVLHFLMEQEDDDLRLLIAGHTDTAGSASHNLELSHARAQSVYCLLMGADWRVEWAGIVNDYHQVSDVQRLLKFLSWRLGAADEYDPGDVDNQFGPKTRSAIWAFQSYYNRVKDQYGFQASPSIQEDGAIGPETWGAFFEMIYVLDLSHMLGCPPVGALANQHREIVRWASPEWPCKGFGESFPIEEAHQDQYRSESNRRVEFLFFPEEDAPSIPDEPAQGSVYTTDECPFYDTAAYARTYVDPEATFNHSLEVQAVSEEGEPVPHVQLLIDPELTGELIAMECDAHGFGRIDEELPPGYVGILHGETVETGRVRIGNELVPARLRTHRTPNTSGIPEVVVTFLSEDERDDRSWIQERYGAPDAPPRRLKGTVTTDPDEIEIRPVEDSQTKPERPKGQKPEKYRGPVAYDNLALVAHAEGRDPHHKRLFETVKQWLYDRHPVVKEHGFYLLVYEHVGWTSDARSSSPKNETPSVWCFNPKGQAEVVAPLDAKTQGFVGAYAPFLMPGDPTLVDMTTRRGVLNTDAVDVTQDGRTNAVDMVAGADTRELIQSFTERYADHFEITYYAPTEASMSTVALRGGSGLLEPYLDHARENIHERNRKTIQTVVSAHALATQHYISQVRDITKVDDVSVMDTITANKFGFGDFGELSEERKAELEKKARRKNQEVKRKTLALKKLGPPPTLYDFRRPPGIREDPEWADLLEEMGKASHWEYRAWKEVSDGINAINERQSQGLPYLKIKVKPKADLRTFRKLVGDSPVEAGAYARWEVETTIDIGSNGTFVKRDPIHVVGADMGVSKGTGKNKKNLVNVTVEVERNPLTGEEKRKFNVQIRNCSFEVADDGSSKITGEFGPIDIVGERNYLTQELGHGIALNTEFGEVYVGVHFMGLTEENIVAYLSRAPGFFERRAVHEFFEPDLLWVQLSRAEQVHMSIFGWTQETWDDRSRTPFREFPHAVYSNPKRANSSLQKFQDLTPVQKLAAARLGIQRHDWGMWKNAALQE